MKVLPVVCTRGSMATRTVCNSQHSVSNLSPTAALMSPSGTHPEGNSLTSELMSARHHWLCKYGRNETNIDRLTPPRLCKAVLLHGWWPNIALKTRCLAICLETETRSVSGNASQGQSNDTFAWKCLYTLWLFPLGVFVSRIVGCMTRISIWPFFFNVWSQNNFALGASTEMAHLSEKVNARQKHCHGISPRDPIFMRSRPYFSTMLVGILPRPMDDGAGPIAK